MTLMMLSKELAESNSLLLEVSGFGQSSSSQFSSPRLRFERNVDTQDKLATHDISTAPVDRVVSHLSRLLVGCSSVA